MATTVQARPTEDDRPWWRYGMVWMVIGGPLIVVIAAVITAVIAIRGQDPVIDTSVDSPAIKARNLAATPPAKP